MTKRSPEAIVCGMHWGRNPDTVTAMATAAATILAVLAAFLAVLDVLRQRKQAQSRQATLVAAGEWIAHDVGVPRQLAKARTALGAQRLATAASPAAVAILRTGRRDGRE